MERACHKEYTCDDVKYESNTCYGSEVMLKVNILEMQFKGHDEGHKVKNMGIDGKGLSQGIHM